MIKHNQNGAVNGLVVSLILATLLLLGALAFGAWAYTSRQDYKDNSDAKAKVAATAAKEKESIAKTQQFAEEAKKPLKTYNGPEAYGSLVIMYPKTWSAYVDDSTKSGSAQVDGYFAPGAVPSITDPTSVFALRVQVVPQAYAQSLQSLLGQQKSGKLAITAYALPKLPNIVGVKAVGQLKEGATTTTMVILPLRSTTLKISTEGNQYLGDFNNSILPNFSFSP